MGTAWSSDSCGPSVHGLHVVVSRFSVLSSTVLRTVQFIQEPNANI